MTGVTRICGKCGAKIFADAPQEYCSACLLETGLGPLVDEIDEAVDAPPALRGRVAARSTRMQTDFGDYELQEEIGRGGQGVVYRARQKSLNRIVALKVIALGHWATQAHVKRFRLEAEAAAHLDDPRIVPIYEIGERDGACYFSMKFIEGSQLDKIISSELMSARKAAELMAKLARTLDYAHQHGVLHRDVKPGNILIDAKGEPHLTDFGLARLVETESTVTRTLEVLGTPSYMAPEQAAGKTAQLTGATDVYGLGAVLYQLLTGHPPFSGGTTYETVRLVLETEPRQPRLWNPKVDRDLATICLKCLEKEPAKRYASAQALAEDLDRFLRREPIRSRRISWLERVWRWCKRRPLVAGLTAALVISVTVGFVGGFWELRRVQEEQALLRRANLSAQEKVRNTSPSVPEKSIAVLPFENLSDDKQNSYFTDGVQDEILADLAKVTDLKVISRTSVMLYKSGNQRNLREIGQQLGVAHVLEGSVQRAGDRVRVTAQLIDSRTDAHLWAQTYDRNLADVFAIQSEIAKTIAEQLQARLSPREKTEIEKPPTSNLAAFDLYTRANALLAGTAYSSRLVEDLQEAAQLLNQAVALDPNFLLAYLGLAFVHDRLYFMGVDHTPTRRALANAALQAAIRLRPDDGETHLSIAAHLYHDLDYDGARAELEKARKTLPNNFDIFELAGYLDRRQARWEDSIRNHRKALELDPGNFGLYQEISSTYANLRRFSEMSAALDRSLEIVPGNVESRVARALADLLGHGDTEPLNSTIHNILSQDPGAASSLAEQWFLTAMCRRDPTEAERAVAALLPSGMAMNGVAFPHPFCQAMVARLRGDEAPAREAFTRARTELEVKLRASPDYANTLVMLGLMDAGLGRKEDAIREGRRAAELAPVSKEALVGSAIVEILGVIYAWTGEKDRAFEQLALSARIPAGVTYGELKLHPYFDPLRSDPRFDKLVASLAPKAANK